MSFFDSLTGKVSYNPLTSEQQVLQQQIDELKRLRRQQKVDRMAEQLEGVFKKMVPRGIRHPDSLIANRDLYIPRGLSHKPRRISLFPVLRRTRLF